MVSEIKKAITNSSKEKSIPIVFNNAGSMFSIFFTNKEINNFLDAKNASPKCIFSRINARVQLVSRRDRVKLEWSGGANGVNP